MNKSVFSAGMGYFLASCFFLFCPDTARAQQDTLQLKLTLEDVVEVAREQSPMATMARHQFRSSYWEYRTYQASLLPSLTLNSTLPDINR
jgi:hypothetical protein